MEHMAGLVLAFPTQMPLPCSAISKCTHGSPAPSSSAQSSVLPCAPLLKRPRHKVEERDETKGQFFFQIFSIPVHLPSYQEPVDHGISPALLFLIYTRYLKSNTFTFGNQKGFFVFFRCQQRAVLSFPQLRSPSHQICVPKICFPMDNSRVHKDKVSGTSRPPCQCTTTEGAEATEHVLKSFTPPLHPSPLPFCSIH